MVRILVLLIACINGGLAFAQTSVGIGTNSPHISAVLDISSNNKGFLVPRMSQTARLTISLPANGLLVYDSTLKRLYQFQDGTWRYMLTNAEWSQSASHSWTFNTADSVGIGTSTPTERLDVNGNIYVSNRIKADNTITADGTITASSFASSGNMIVNGDLSVSGDALTHGNLVIDDPSAIIQLQNSNVKKGFAQLSGNDLRFGTNSGNTNGTVILRMNGTDAASIDRFGNIRLLQTSTHEGEVMIGWRCARNTAPTVNMLPVLFGLVPASGSAGGGWMSPLTNGSWTRVSTGKYEITTAFGIITPYSSIIVTAAELGLIAIATYLSTDKFRVEIFDGDGDPVDAQFTYVVNDPLN